MKKIIRDPEKIAAIELYDAVGSKIGFNLNDGSGQDQFLKSISESLGRDRSNPIVLHGKRTEYMFGYVIASLGKYSLIKIEDSGETYTQSSDIQIPDWRIAKPSEQFLVEVKNHHPKNPLAKFRLKRAYWEKLKRYGDLCGCEVKLAVYWSEWNIWTLNSPEKMTHLEDNIVFDLGEGMKKNEMNLFGDMSIGTTPPLKFRLVANREKPGVIREDGTVEFTIGKVELWCGPNEIKEKLEKSIAFYFMLWGKWPCSRGIAKINNGVLEAVEYIAEPENYTDNQNFEFVGELSGMLSRQYNEATSTKGQITCFSPKIEPEMMNILMDINHKGDKLPLSRFILRPNYET